MVEMHIHGRTRGNHKFTVASMVSRRAGRAFSDLACGTGGHRIRTVPARGAALGMEYAVCLGLVRSGPGCRGLGLDPYNYVPGCVASPCRCMVRAWRSWRLMWRPGWPD